MERKLLTLIFMFLEIIGSLSQDRSNPTPSTPSAVPVHPPPPPSVPPPPPPPPPFSPSPPHPSPPPPSSPPPPPPSPPRPPPPPKRRRNSPGATNSTKSTPPPPRRHPSPPHGNNNGSLHVKKNPVRKNNLGKKIGILFAGIAGILQVAVVGFLVFKRRQISKIKDRHDT